MREKKKKRKRLHLAQQAEHGSMRFEQQYGALKSHQTWACVHLRSGNCWNSAISLWFPPTVVVGLGPSIVEVLRSKPHYELSSGEVK